MRFSISVRTVPFFSVPAMTVSKETSRCLLVHCLSAHTDGAKRSLIDQIGEISAYGTSGYLCNPVQVYILGELDVSGVQPLRSGDDRQDWAYPQ